MTPAASERWRVRGPLIAAAAMSWIVLLTQPESKRLSFCDPSVWASLSTDKFLFVLDGLGPVDLAWGWLVMVVAMMAPMLTRNVAHVRARSLPVLRAWATSLFLLGYMVIWLLLAPPIFGSLILIEMVQTAARLALPVAIVIAFIWQFSPAKQICLNRCHRAPPLGARGMRHSTSVFAYGLTQGFWCCGTCWALMLVVLLVDQGHMAAMILASCFLIAERFDGPDRPAFKVRYPKAIFRMINFYAEKRWRRQTKALEQMIVAIGGRAVATARLIGKQNVCRTQIIPKRSQRHRCK